ncbi:hypothetical protein COD67_23545 [Bacillus cereus]|nr:hypothetical protein COI89_19560 [Bacillus cereus]PGU61974.1 hypothetical protein COD67_23545 [Bacillus cereus]
MRYARGAQYGLYFCKGNNKAYKWFKKARKGMGNITIKENKTLWPYKDKLDPTFRWKRDFDSVFTNLIFFRGESRQLKVILAKESMQKLKKQGWIN